MQREFSYASLHKWRDYNTERKKAQHGISSLEAKLEKCRLYPLLYGVEHHCDIPIPSPVADHLCHNLGVDGLLHLLNTLLSTHYEIKDPHVHEFLQRCVDDKWDVGLAYGIARPRWTSRAIANLQEKIDKMKKTDTKTRSECFAESSDMIDTSKLAYSRRFWDLVSNRVVPSYVLRPKWVYHPVSHSRVAKDERHFVKTPINGYEWDVPIPTDVTLDRIRIELLNYNQRYVWLDVLCLRQEFDGESDYKRETRIEEWKVDVPTTIGNVYQSFKEDGAVIRYLSGLGRPSDIGDIEGQYHWRNRVWTLQEYIW